MTQLRATPTTGNTIPEHVNDHAQIHKKLNDLVVDVKNDFGATGDGTTDDTANIQAAIAAAPAGAVVYFPVGTYLTTGISFSGVSCVPKGAGYKSIIKAKSGITGAVLDFEGWTAPGNAYGRSEAGDFVIQGDNTADATKTHYGIVYTGVTGLNLKNIAVKETGGACFYSEGGNWNCDFHSIVLGRPIGADTNDVPYLHIWGWMNGARWFGLGLRSVSSSMDGSAGILIEGRDSLVSHDTSFYGTWFENTHVPANGAGVHLEMNTSTFEFPQLFDCTGPSGDTTNCVVRLATPNTGPSEGGNWVYGHISGSSAATDIYYGVEVEQSRNRIEGTRGYNSRCVHLLSGADYTYVSFGGQQSGTTAGTNVTDDSGASNNQLLDWVAGTLKTRAMTWTIPTLTLSAGLKIGAGTEVKKHISGSKTWDPGSVNDGAVTSTTVTVTGAAIGNPVAVGFSTAVPAGALLVGAVTATDTVTVTLMNHTGAPLDLASGTLRASVWQY